MTHATRNTETWTFVYDAAQSRTWVTEPGGYASYQINNENQVTRETRYPSGVVTYGYDGAGNRITKNSETYVYDYRDQLVTVKNHPTSPTVSWNFRYDVLGRRVAEERVAGGTTTTRLFYYAGGDIVVETDGSHAVQRESVFGVGVDRLEWTNAGAGERFPLEDSLGSVLAVTDGTGAVKTSFTYTPYGELTRSGTETYPYAFTGRRYNEDFKLYDYRTRFYDPKLGRFLQRDTIGIWGDGVGLGNGYGYVGNNPVNRVDPWGLCPPGSSTCHTPPQVEGLGGPHPPALDPNRPGYGLGNPGRTVVGPEKEEDPNKDKEEGECEAYPKGESGNLCKAGCHHRGYNPYRPVDWRRDFALLGRLLQGLGGAAEIVSGALTLYATSGTAWVGGSALILNGLDNLAAAIAGSRTITAQGSSNIAGLVMSENAAYWVGEGVNALFPLAGGAAVASAIKASGLVDDAARSAVGQVQRPPGWNENWEWRPGSREAGGMRWWDEAGGEWRWHPADKWHPQGHWDHNPWTEWNSPWQNVPGGG